MIDIEELLERLQREGLTLAQAPTSCDPEVLRGLQGKKNQQHIAAMLVVEAVLADYELVVVSDSLKAYQVAQQLARNGNAIGLDIETARLTDHPQAGLLPSLSRIRLVQLFDGNTTWVIDCDATGGVDWIEPLQHAPLIAHNAAFEAAHFHHSGVVFKQLDCSMLMGRAFLNANISLAKAAKDALELDMDKALQVSDWSRPVLLPEQIRYAALDAVVARKLSETFEQWFDEHPGYRQTYGFLARLIYPLVRQQAHGIRFDHAAHDRIVAEWESGIAQAQAVLRANGLDKPASNKARQQLLMAQLSDAELESWPKTPTGGLSTGRGVLQRAIDHPILGALAEFTTLSARHANFGPKLRGLLVNGGLYPSYKIASMVSGRFGCGNPNIQNQPREGFKHVYRAPEGCQFVAGDLAQVELRVAGLISGDPVILDAYARGEDLHRLMAAKMTGKPVEAISKAERTAAKGVNFGLLYGSGGRGLKAYVRASYGLSMTMTEAEEAKTTFLRTYPVFAEWQRWVVRETNRLDYSESTYSKLRRHYGPEAHHRAGEYSDIYTHAMNFPIQSSAWEILALAILYIDEHAPDGVRISHHVYDELVLVAPKSQVLEAGRLLRTAFEYGYRQVFPGCDLTGIVEIGAGRNWSEAGADSNIMNLN